MRAYVKYFQGAWPHEVQWSLHELGINPRQVPWLSLMIGASGFLVSLSLENLEARRRHLNLMQAPSELDGRITGALETLGI